MTDRKISQLPTREELTGQEYFHIAYNGKSYKVNMNQLVALFTNGVDVDTIQKLEQILANAENHVTQKQLQEAIDGIGNPTVDLTGLVTEQQLQDALASITHPDADLSGLATKEYVDRKVDGTKEYVDRKVDGTKEYVDQKVAGTEEYVDSILNSIEVPDLAPYAKSAEVVDAISTAVDHVTALIPNGKVNNILFVTGEVVEGADGSINKPFETLQQAIDVVTTGGVILVTKALSNQGEIVINNKSNFIVQGFGCNGSHPVIIYGNIVIKGSSTRAGFKDIAIRPDTGKVGVEFQGDDGRHYFDNVDITSASTNAVEFTQGAKRWSAFTQCTISGDVLVANCDANVALYFNQHNSLDTNLYVNSSCNVSIINAIQFGYVENNLGNVSVKHASSFKGKNGLAIKGSNDSTTVAVFCDFSTPTGFLGIDKVTAHICNKAIV